MYSFKFRNNTVAALFIEVAFILHMYYLLVIFTWDFFNFYTVDGKKMNTTENGTLKNPFNPLCS